MLDPSELKNFRPLIATPCYGGSVFYNYVLSIINLVDIAREHDMLVDFHYNPGDSLVTRARNDIVARFLSNTSFTHLFWIDGDIGFSREAALRLLLSGHDIAAGIYPIKRENWPAEGVPEGTTREQFNAHFASFPVNISNEDIKDGKVEIAIDADGFVKVREAPTGFMLIKRSVFDALVDHYPDYRYTPDWPEGSYPEGGVHYRFFDTMIDPESNRYLSEDYAFCHLLRPLGIDVHIDARSNLTHFGSKQYEGDLSDTIIAAPGRAINAKKGTKIRYTGLQNLKPTST